MLKISVFWLNSKYYPEFSNVHPFRMKMQNENGVKS